MNDPTFIVDFGSSTVKYGSSRKTRRVAAHLAAQATQPLCKQCPTRLAPSTEGAAPIDLLTPAEHLVELLGETEGVSGGSDWNMLCLVNPLLPKRKKEHLLRIAFEELAAKRVCIAYTASTALFSVGHTSGVVVDIGHLDTLVTPVIHATPLLPLTARLSNQGGRTIDDALLEAILALDGDVPLISLTSQYFHTLKSSCCALSAEHVRPFSSNAVGAPIPLPDGSSLRCPLAAEDIARCSCALVTGGPVSPFFAAQQCVREAVMAVPTGWQPAWMLCGASAAIPGVSNLFADALNTKVNPFLPLNQTNSVGGKLELVQLQNRDVVTAAWHGGSLLAQLSSFPGMCVDRELYDESGPREALRFSLSDSR